MKHGIVWLHGRPQENLRETVSLLFIIFFKLQDFHLTLCEMEVNSKSLVQDISYFWLQRLLDL